MIANYHNDFVWNVMKKNKYVRIGLERAGFTGGWLQEDEVLRGLQKDEACGGGAFVRIAESHAPPAQTQRVPSSLGKKPE